jgi:hypothetical protein
MIGIEIGSKRHGSPLFMARASETHHARIGSLAAIADDLPDAGAVW